MEDETPQTPPPTRPHLPSHKQTRINIWRTEVASLTPQPRPPCSSAQSTTTTATSSSFSSGGASTTVFPSPADDAAPRARPSFWRRLSKRLRGKADEPESGAVANGLRTEMYREDLGTWAEPSPAAVDVASSEGGRGLKDKQERLERAARLLNQSAEKP